ncbi:MAG: MotA/TolQ/ExbB proton channel family protein [bacterium]|nr:MotA/TolQ/ExbB proton channel family protein [bacterium]
MFERSVYFAKLKLKTSSFLKRIRSLIQNGELKEAVEYCNSTNHPIGRMTKDIIQFAGLPRGEILKGIEKTQLRERASLESHVGVLSIISFIAPLLGLLGTVIGIVHAFSSMAATGGGTPTAMMAGIAVALLTTAIGIIIAVPSAIAFGFFSGKVDAVKDEMKIVGSSILRVLSQANLIDKTVSEKIRRKLTIILERPNPSEASEALVPGINVALLIICFFMIFIPNMYQTNITVSAPALTRAQPEQDEKKTELKLNIHIDKAGMVYINNEKMPPDTAIQNELIRQLLLRSIDRLCVISADEGLYHYQVVDMIDRATQCGAEKVCLLKRKT